MNDNKICANPESYNGHFVTDGKILQPCCQSMHFEIRRGTITIFDVTLGWSDKRLNERRIRRGHYEHVVGMGGYFLITDEDSNVITMGTNCLHCGAEMEVV